VAPGTSYKSNPHGHGHAEREHIFTNCALTDDGDIWWEGWTAPPPSTPSTGRGATGRPQRAEPAAHPNARFTAPASQCPIICPDWEKPEGVPIDIFIFGGRRAGGAPGDEAFDWDHGVFMGATAGSETTAANIGAVGNCAATPSP
jgi:phosphoenolpyruvate carboxykinase (GTP)